jgi:uncharacterized membrane protein YkoI
MNRRTSSAAALAVAVGVLGGGYGVAGAATGKIGKTNAARAANAGGQRAAETPLTGDTLAKVSAAALAKVAGGTIVRAETDADGNALYEAHMTNASGAPMTVYVDKDFNVVSVDASTGGPGGRGGHGGPGGQRSDETPLTGDTLSKATAAALAKVSGGTVVRAETDGDGKALYEVHMKNASGAQVTVYLDKDFNVTSVDTGH